MSRTQSPLSRLAVPDRGGIEVEEEELGLIKAQLMYRLRCECGRSWFDITLPKLVQCPSCAKKGMVLA
jgi:hypothetical protein